MMSADSFNTLSAIDPDLTALTDEERNKVIAVMKKAKDFEQQEGLELMRQPIEGSLSKYTNVMKGWQFRWFVLEPDAGRLEYYEKEEYKIIKQKPRGYVQLAGTVIAPSDEDSQTFNVNASNGDIYRLRASDARERQVWVNRLRATSEYHTDALLRNPQSVRENRAPISGVSSGSMDSLNKSSENLRKMVTNSKNQNLPNAASPRKNSPVVIKKRSHRKYQTGSAVNLSDTQFREVKDMLTQVSHQMQTLTYKIGDLPSVSSECPHTTQRDMLLLKATSRATLTCLDGCLAILQQQHQATSQYYTPAVLGSGTKLPPHYHRAARTGSISPAESFVSVNSHNTDLGSPYHSAAGPAGGAVNINHSHEVEDEGTYHDTDLEGVEEHKSVILHLLSQLKLGMDLTKVVLPTFILEKRSLLEMFADTMAHPDLFVAIPDQPTPEARMLAVLQWYLTSFHAGRQGCLAKKPYNPIIGETFHCSWKVNTADKTTTSSHNNNHRNNRKQQNAQRKPENNNHPTTTTTSTQPDTCDSDNNKDLHINNNSEDYNHTNGDVHTENSDTETLNESSNDSDNVQSRLSGDGGEGSTGEEGTGEGSTEEVGEEDCGAECGGENSGRLVYTAEQVSHHPPISAFYFECPDKRMYMSSSIYTKSKFLGMSIGVSMVGKAYLHLLSHGEVYEFSLPSAYARSILTVPWVELGDKVSVSCPATGYSAAVIFHVKPFYGGRLHKVTSEVKNPTGDIIAKVNGEWNNELEFTFINDEKNYVIGVDSLPVRHKCVRALGQQGEGESRRLWQHVTRSLQADDLNTATEHKRFLEERQRQGEKVRRENNRAFPIRNFHIEGDNWVYNNCLR